MLNHEHKPTGQWRTEKGKSEANCSECGWYETTLVEKTSPTPLTVDTLYKAVLHEAKPLYDPASDHRDIAIFEEAVYRVIEDEITTLTTQHTKEKEEIVRKTLAMIQDESNRGIMFSNKSEDIAYRFKIIAENHNITI